MITIIDRGGFTELKAKLEQQLQASMQQNTDLTITLDERGHHIQYLDMDYSLNYQDFEFQKLLDKSKHPLLQAIGTKKRQQKILDACAGLGRDGFILAHAGHSITSCELHPILFVLLEQAIGKIVKLKGLHWTAVHDNCQNLMTPGLFDIIYLDPMFSATSKAKPKLMMQIIQQLAPKDPFTFWDMAWQNTGSRLVFKHSSKTPTIATLPKPRFQVSNERSVRFDVYCK